MKETRPIRIALVTSGKSGLTQFIQRDVEALIERGQVVRLFMLLNRPGLYSPLPEWDIEEASRVGALFSLILLLARKPAITVRLMNHARRFGVFRDLAIAAQFTRRMGDLDILFAYFGDHKLFVAYYCKQITGLPRRCSRTPCGNGAPTFGSDRSMRRLHATTTRSSVSTARSGTSWTSTETWRKRGRTSDPRPGAVRKARSEGVEIRPATSKAELRIFFDHHLRTRKRKYGLLAQPYAFFENIWDEFVEQDRGELLVATHGGRIVAGVFFLEWGGTMYYKFNASDPDSVGVRPNDLIVWTAAERFTARGVSAIDFGLSDWDQEGLIRYKRKYATSEGEITFLRSKGAPALDEDAGATLSRITELLTGEEIPDSVTEKAGSLLYRNFA